ncbi:YbaB/EbfC family nucleoid-associated protein [Spirochaetia bacterium 38H-sp]|uniref:Nucleoid-associated protein WKV44_01320 n=1 Tax=Rarispira pelagica TaxID=3141764 RepID=A0ABU9U938_9SPIR
MNPFDLIKNFGSLQEKMTQAQEELKKLKVSGESGAGMVKIVMRGDFSVEEVKIDPSIVNSDEVGLLEDLVASALSSAMENLKSAMQDNMKNSFGSELFFGPGGNIV